MKIIAGLDLTDISVEEPDLEEIFMHYYQKES
jgi:ABC-2 type transport system ATP-binding protein